MSHDPKRLDHHLDIALAIVAAILGLVWSLFCAAGCSHLPSAVMHDVEVTKPCKRPASAPRHSRDEVKCLAVARNVSCAHQRGEA